TGTAPVKALRAMPGAQKKGPEKTGPQMTNETRKVRKNYNLKSHPLRFRLLTSRPTGSVAVL
ncbi:hypothetical protein, partial [uncultured Marinobacter sp.]|uniref:hypothetical protein n=1 Tax=uncultured Marinobacter sp. TaxID=187379 RepID=UPI00259499D3